MNYSTYDPKISNSRTKRNAGDIQAQIDLRLLAKFHIGQPLFSTSSSDTHINVLNPDGLELHISNSHYRDPDTGDRGGAIKFIQKIRRCSYGDAIAYLEGWLDLISFAQTRNLDSKTTDLPMQLPLFKFIAESSKL